jgi:type IV pilus assembly protein PilC
MKLSLSNHDRLTLISTLATMLKAGIPILEAVDSLIGESKGNAKKLLKALRDDLNQGKTVSQSFSRFPNAWDPVTVNLIKAAEESGKLDETLKDITVNLKKDIEFSDRVTAAMVYPLFVVAIFFIVIIIVLVFVIPKVAAVFSRLSVQLPLPTRILIFVSHLVLTYTPFIIGGVVALVIILVMLYRSQRKFLFNLFFSLPLLSQLAKEIDLTRFTRSMSLLLSSGIPITDALDLSRDVVAKKEIHKAITIALQDVTAGKKLSEGFKNSHKNIPSIMVRFIEAGERSGSLEQSMQELTEYFDTAVSNTLKTVTTLLEPVMLVVIGLSVGGLMMSIVAPIYNLIGQISAH